MPIVSARVRARGAPQTASLEGTKTGPGFPQRQGSQTVVNGLHFGPLTPSRIFVSNESSSVLQYSCWPCQATSYRHSDFWGTEVVGSTSLAGCVIKKLFFDHPAGTESKSTFPRRSGSPHWQVQNKVLSHTLVCMEPHLSHVKEDTPALSQTQLWSTSFSHSPPRLPPTNWYWSFISFAVLDLPFHCDYKNIY